jgi:hypothetical protein
MGLKETEYEGTDLTDSGQGLWQALSSTIMNFWVPQKNRLFLVGYVLISFSKDLCCMELN